MLNHEIEQGYSAPGATEKKGPSARREPDRNWGGATSERRQMVSGRMRDGNPRGDAAAWREVGYQRHAAGLKNSHQIIQNAVGHVLIEDAFASKRLQVQFQTLELHAKLVRNVAKRERAEIGLARLRAQRRKLRTDDFDAIVATQKLICKRFKLFSRRLW